jgi:hypothetical protein
VNYYLHTSLELLPNYQKSAPSLRQLLQDLASIVKLVEVGLLEPLEMDQLFYPVSKPCRQRNLSSRYSGNQKNLVGVILYLRLKLLPIRKGFNICFQVIHSGF